MRGLHFAINKLTETKRQKREAREEQLTLRLNPGAFVKKALANGKDKTMSTYWTYKGSLTTPGKYVIIHIPCHGGTYFIYLIATHNLQYIIKNNYISNFEIKFT